MSGMQFHLATDSGADLERISGRCSDSERRYTIAETEILAVVRESEECAWLVNYSLKVYTDHKRIIHSMANRGCVHGKVSRWIDILGEFDVEYVHRSNSTKIMEITVGLGSLPTCAIMEPCAA